MEDLQGKKAQGILIRNKKNWHDCCVICWCNCCHSSWIQFIAWTHIVLCTLTIVLTTVAMLLTTGSLADILFLLAALTFIPLALCLPLTPAFLLQWAFTSTFSNLTVGGRLVIRGGTGGRSTILIWMEVLVFAIFLFMALILLYGYHKKKPRFLLAWQCFAVTSILLIVMETIIVSAMSIIWSNGPSDLFAIWIPVVRVVVPTLPLLWATTAIHRVRKEIQDQKDGEVDEEDADEYLDLRII